VWGSTLAAFAKEFRYNRISAVKNLFLAINRQSYPPSIETCSHFSCLNVHVAHVWKALESRHMTDRNKDDFHVVVM